MWGFQVDIAIYGLLVILWILTNTKRSSKSRLKLMRSLSTLELKPTCFQGFNVPGQGKGISKTAYVKGMKLQMVEVVMVCKTGWRGLRLLACG
ncbi:Os09g0477700 [Oryza sativa Japonica Group]|uniref:Os09g0477700 protein n=1 Tax=Oryza sativa subsp. japonica TaxID=39947 RepID=Q0J0Y5_ORYSJ|nr:Os09g0477700 [Oryza sativa Japonica Group]|eukprot:NP_001063466.1 Os09g0477700 [Oryza sativa Japonica Group]